MILKVFMLLLLTTGYNDGGISITSIEFSSMQSCNVAKQEIINSNKYASRLTIQCYNRR